MKEIEGIEVRKLAPEYIEGFKQIINLKIRLKTPF